MKSCSAVTSSRLLFLEMGFKPCRTDRFAVIMFELMLYHPRLLSWQSSIIVHYPFPVLPRHVNRLRFRHCNARFARES